MSENFTVILDAGHGGSAANGGSTPNNAVGAGGLLEKDLTLNLAMIAAAKLHSKGFRVVLTRARDENPALTERAGKSKETGADAFVSIHFNASKDEQIDGTEVFVSKASDERDFALANELLTNTASAADISPRGIRRTNFTVLKGDFHLPKTAACLIEIAYLTNPRQAQKLLSPVYVERLAEAVARSISNYSKRLSYAKSLAGVDSGIEKKIAEISKQYSGAKIFPALGFSYGSDDQLSSMHFQPLDYLQTRAFEGCESSQEIASGAEFVEFGLMKVKSDLTNPAKNVCLRWNKIPANICELDVVVHFHGFDIRDKKDRTEPFFKYVEKISGLDLRERTRPTLCILPFGYSTDNWQYSFPFFSDRDGLKKIVDFSLKYLADIHKLKNGFSLGRVILTAHSGGGAVVRAILKHKNAGTLEPKGKDIDEVHLFDATYGGADVFNTWAEEKIKSKSGALRVLYRVCGPDTWKYKQKKVKKDGKEELEWYCDEIETETKARKIGVKLDSLIPKDSPLRKSFRVEETKVLHNDIPKTFGFQLLGDPRRDLIPSPSKATDKPAKDVLCCPTFPNCVCRDKPAELKSLGLDYEDAEYFADGETSFENY